MSNTTRKIIVFFFKPLDFAIHTWGQKTKEMSANI